MFHRYTFGFLCLLTTAAPAAAQILYGGLVGNVTDKTQAAVAGATVTVTNEQTGSSRSGSSGDAGIYQFPTLVPGPYTLTVQAKGFRTYKKTGVVIEANVTERVNTQLDIGDVTEQVTVSADAAALQTESAEVRRTVHAGTLENVPIPLGRNYQSLLATLPGISPPQDSGSFPANPSRSLQFSVNGASISVNNIRIDGASSYNPSIAQNTALNPTIESLEVVDVVTGSMNAEQGLAGGASINLQMKSGTNQIHGSAFWYHNNQHLNAYPFFSDRTSAKPKFISNHPGGTIGGPIRKNRIFYFVSYERSAENQNAQAFLSVPTAQMRRGDLSASSLPIYDPFSGADFNPANPNVYAGDRKPFPNNQIPTSRFSGPTQRILALPDWPLPNYTGTGALGITNNYLGSAGYWTRRDQIDSKANYNLTPKWTAFTRFSYLYYNQQNPAAFGELDGPGLVSFNTRPGTGFGWTYSGTVSTTYVATSSLVFDGYFGYTLQDINAGPENIETPFARDVLKIPNTNGPTSFSGGMAKMTIDTGFSILGYQQASPNFFTDHLTQYAANGNWNHGRHNVRFGFETLRFNLNEQVANPAGANGGPAGGFFFRAATTSLRNGPNTNAYNGFAAFLLGTVREGGRSVLNTVLRPRTRDYGLYISDRWQLSPRLTLSYGLRWEYYPQPTRDNRGLERYDFNTNEMLVCGVGSVPEDCGTPQSKRLFAPHVGVAWRAMNSLVVRTGYGISFDPYNFGRDLRGNYPTQFSQNLAFPDTRAWSTTLDQGLPPIPPPLQGDRLPMPATAALLTEDQNYRRGYIESWNFTLEKQVGQWIATAGYVGNRSIRQLSFLDANYALPGTGAQGQLLFQKFQRSASTLFLGDIGRAKYDGLQTRIERRFRGYSLQMSYTWSKARGFEQENSTASPRVAIPAYWGLNYGPTTLDLAHNLAATSVIELPFGQGKPWMTHGTSAAVLGGWQLNVVAGLHTGFPVTPTAPATVLNAPGSSNNADCLGPITTLGSPNQWWSTTNLADPNVVSPRTPRFGTCGVGVLRGPGLVNFDLGMTRRFRITERLNLQFRAEGLNISNTPHFASPSADISSANFGVVTAIANTGRDGVDQRLFGFGLRLGW